VSDRPKGRPKIRLFAGIELPADVRTAIEVATAPLRTTIPGFRWVPHEDLHLTLVFVGWVEPGDVESIAAALGGAVAAAPRFTARLGGAGRFPDRGKARVLWVGFAAGADALAELAERARAGIADRVTDARPFRPHVTVARARQPARVTAGTLDIAPLDRDVSVDAVTVFRSYLGSPHPRYEPIARLGLQGGSAAG
jgi:RNA 2',3'-cyclic 3'-phosphodiesterase